MMIHNKLADEQFHLTTNKPWLVPIYLSNAVILDTETTGVMHTDEICEISVIDAITGEAILDTLIKPLKTIPAEVTKIHGISNDDVKNAPSYIDVHQQLMTIFKQKKVIIYNADFDIRLIQQTASLYNLQTPDINEPIKYNPNIVCAMKWYAKYNGDWNSYRSDFKWISLNKAAKKENLDISQLKAHRANADCKITQQLIHDVNRKILLQNDVNLTSI